MIWLLLLLLRSGDGDPGPTPEPDDPELPVIPRSGADLGAPPVWIRRME